MNTWFKKSIHLGTWVHPATKQTHTIDFVMMSRDQRQLCADVRMYRSACCWTDHYLVKRKLILCFSWKKKKGVTSVPLAVHLLRSQGVRDRYQQSLLKATFTSASQQSGRVCGGAVEGTER